MIGMFWMAIPIPSQMLVAAVFAIIFRANLPLSVALVWISNPLTMPPIFYFNYVVGTYILGQQAAEDWHFELSWEWMIHTLDDLWMPLFLGSAVVGLALGLISYVIINLLWRHHAIKAWNARRSKKWRKKFREEEKAQRDHS